MDKFKVNIYFGSCAVLMSYVLTNGMGIERKRISYLTSTKTGKTSWRKENNNISCIVP